MRALFRVSFGKKKEYYIDDFHAVEYQLGDALIAVLSTDLKPFLSKLDHNSYDSFALLSSAIVIEQRGKIEAIHPFFEMEMIPLSNHASPMKEMERRLEVIMKIQQDLTPLVDAVFLPEQSDLTTMQRLCRYLSKDPLAAASVARASEVLRAEQRIYINGKPFEPVFSSAWKDEWDSEPPTDILSRQVVGCDEMQPVLLAEIFEMANQNVHLRRCEYCHKYFRPFSSKSIYCSRMVGNTGKTCKEVAAKEKHTKKVAANEGRALYRRRNKAYAMRVSRTPEVYKDVDYQVWKAAAKVALQQYTDGEITLEMLDVMIELPKTK